MTAKEKANKLYKMYRGFNNETKEVNHITAKQCADLLCDEMITEIKTIDPTESAPFVVNWLKYWIGIKAELNAL